MFIAKDENGNIVTIEEVVNNKAGKYFCPTCNASLRIDSKESDKKRIHFKHTKKCTDDWKYEMSEWHYNWQCQFPKENREVVISDGVETHRTDVFINNTVIEFQHSNISREDFTARNRFYTNCGYTVVWVFEAKDKLQNVYDKTFLPLSSQDVRYNNGFLIKEYSWKRKNTCFEEFIPFNNCVNIFLETNVVGKETPIYLYINPCNSKVIEAIYTDVYIEKENMLKQFGINTEKNVKDVKQIISECIQREKQRKKQLAQAYMNYPTPYVKTIKRKNRF